ncbi:NAC domain-containing protein 78-like [Syzygium oleosum]|uniref:NAC domain-containing protein 78-like n=1 Tax=Syzygium oleosum TaxID=219896 RepID=UPI0011D1EEBE|nr:NAC domain-containing protein 78-like [Syzygium oleosum]
MGRDSLAKLLAPGFRFHPTDEELVRYYLKRKVSGKPLRIDAISDVDVYRCEPWDLPDKSKLKTRDREWYFFSALDKKYANGSKTNRATENGYWKTTGKDRPIFHYSRTVGMKKTLVYHNGRAPRGQRTNWVMHEYRLTDEELEKAGIPQDSFVLCRIFQKSGPGPKNGEQYGAPFIEEEWEDDDVALFPDQEAMVVVDDEYVEADDLDQSIDVGIESGDAPVPLNFHHGETSQGTEHSNDLTEDEQKPLIETNAVQAGSQQQDEQFFVLPEQYRREMKAIEKGYIDQSDDNANPVDANYFLNGPYLDGAEDHLPGDEFYLQTNDLANLLGEDAADFAVDDYLTFFDADDENVLPYESSQLPSENALSDHTLNAEHVNGGNEEVPLAGGNLPSESCSKDSASTSKPHLDSKDPDESFKYPLMKAASQMLGSFPAPPAFAAEFPVKNVALHLNSAAQPSSSAHVTAGMIRIRNMNLVGSGMDWSVGKNGELNIVLSFGMSQADVSPINSGLLSRKTPSVVSWSWCFFLFFWIILISVSVKVGTSIYSR